MEQVVRAVPSVGNWVQLAEERLKVGDTEGASSAFEEALRTHTDSETLWLRYASLMPTPLNTLILERGCQALPLSFSLQRHLLNHLFNIDRSDDATIYLKAWVNATLALGRPLDVQRLLQYYIEKCLDPLHLTHILSELFRLDLQVELVERLYGLFPMLATRLDKAHYITFCFQCFIACIHNPEDVLMERGWIAARGLYYALLCLPNLDSLISDVNDDAMTIYKRLFLYRESLMNESVSNTMAAIRRYLSLAIFYSLTTGIIDDSITPSIFGLSIFSIIPSPNVILSASLTTQVIYVLKVSHTNHNLVSYAVQVLQLWRSEPQTCIGAELLLFLSELFLCLKKNQDSNLTNEIKSFIVELSKMESCFPLHRSLLCLNKELGDISLLSHLRTGSILTPELVSIVERYCDPTDPSNEALIAQSLLYSAQHGKPWLRCISSDMYTHFAELLCNDAPCPTFRTCLCFAMTIPIMSPIQLHQELLNNEITSSSVAMLILCARLMIEGELTDIHSIVIAYAKHLISMRQSLLQGSRETGRFLYLKASSLLVSVIQLANRLGLSLSLFYILDTLNIEGVDFNTYRFEE